MDGDEVEEPDDGDGDLPHHQPPLLLRTRWQVARLSRVIVSTAPKTFALMSHSIALY